MQFDYKLVDEPDGTTTEIIHTILRDFNATRNLAFFRDRNIGGNVPRPLNVVVRNSAGAVVGGLFAETQLLWLRISIMAVAIEYRGCGIGKSLIHVAEDEAVARHCAYSFVDTMSYQAPGFYQKLGYHVAGRLANWDSHGHEKLFLIKQLSAGRGYQQK